MIQKGGKTHEKKWIAGILAALMAFSADACSGKAENEDALQNESGEAGYCGSSLGQRKMRRLTVSIPQAVTQHSICVQDRLWNFRNWWMRTVPT